MIKIENVERKKDMIVGSGVLLLDRANLERKN